MPGVVLLEVLVVEPRVVTFCDPLDFPSVKEFAGLIGGSGTELENTPGAEVNSNGASPPRLSGCT